jgi:putative serine protease PepD
LETLQESVAAKVKPSIVVVYVTLPHNQAAIGSGVIVDSRGYMVTNNHVVSGALTIQVMLFNGTKEAAQMAGADPNYDLAVLKMAVPQGGLTVATLGNSAQLQVGRRCWSSATRWALHKQSRMVS